MSGGRDDSHKVGQWGQFDPARQGDAAKFEYYGGTEDQYKGMTPEQQQQYASLLDSMGDPKSLGGKPWKEQQAAVRAFVSGIAKPGGQGGGGADGQGAGPASDYMQAATPGSHTPFGDTTWTQDPKTGQWTQNQGLNGPLSGANDSIQAQWAEMLKKPMADGSAARDQAIDSAYKQSTSRLDPQWDKRMEAERTQLLNQGLDPTSEAGKNAMSELGMQRNDAYSSAMNNAIGQGTAAGNSVFQNNLAAYNNPIQQMMGLKNLSQGPNNSSLLNALIAQKNGELGKATLLGQQQSDMMGGAMDLMKAYAQYL